jgi:ribose/xylose/arabinose/galactoside ABC-type transport system permease subunit
MISLAPLEKTLGKATLDSTSRSTKVKHFIGDYGLLIVFAIVILFLALAAPRFLSIDNLVNVIRQSSIIGFLALGMTFVMITAGIDLSVGSVVGLTGVVAATLAPGDGSALLLPIVAGVGIGLVVGFLNSALIIWGAILPFLATLAMMALVRSGALIYTNGQPVTGLSEPFQWLGSGMIGPVPVPVVLFVIAAIITDFVLSKTRFGRHVYALGGNEESSRKVGISVRKVLMGVYVLAGLLAAVGGLVLTARVDGADPLAGTGYELQAIAAVVIGGTSLFGGVGTIRGTVVGVLLVAVVLNGLNLLNVSSYYQQAAQGIILVLAVFLNRWKSS